MGAELVHDRGADHGVEVGRREVDLLQHGVDQGAEFGTTASPPRGPAAGRGTDDPTSSAGPSESSPSSAPLSSDAPASAPDSSAGSPSASATWPVIDVKDQRDVRRSSSRVNGATVSPSSCSSSTRGRARRGGSGTGSSSTVTSMDPPATAVVGARVSASDPSSGTAAVARPNAVGSMRPSTRPKSTRASADFLADPESAHHTASR